VLRTPDIWAYAIRPYRSLAVTLLTFALTMDSEASDLECKVSDFAGNDGVVALSKGPAFASAEIST
jgi:hypothetical protein